MRAKQGERVEGVLEAFFETGSEGIIWSVVVPGKDDYEGLYHLCKGDRLTVFGYDGNVRWTGEIDYDWKVGYAPYPLNPTLGQQQALGCWVHGIQKGFTPDAWAQLFFDRQPGTRGGLRAHLVKGPHLDPFSDGYDPEELPDG